MSSSVIERPIAGSHPVIQYSSPWKSSWHVEAWRAGNQYFPILLFSILGVMFVQAALCMSTNLPSTIQEMKSSHAAIYQAAAYGPLAFAIGVICTVCGLDRESKAWNWRSTFPVSWRQDLAVVVGSLLLGSLTCLVCNSGFAWLLDSLWIDKPLDEIQRSWIYNQFQSVALISFPTLAILASGLLWFDNIGLGLAVGTAVAFLLHGLCLLIIELTGHSNDAFLRNAWWLSLNVILAFGSIGLGVYTYRWRRTSGQYWQWTSGQSSGLNKWVTESHQPTAAKALRWQSLMNIRYYVAVLTLIAVANIVVALFLGQQFQSAMTAEPWTILLCGLIGMECFGADRSNGSLRFLSDRGVSPTTVWWSRLRTTSMLMLAPILVMLFFHSWVQSAEQVAQRFFWVVSAFFVMMLSRLCFRSWLAAVAFGFLFLVFNGELLQLQHFGAGIYGQGIATIVLATLCSYFSYKAWHALNRAQEAKTERYFVLFAVGLISFNILIFPALRAFSVPSPSISIAKLKADAEQAPIVPNFDSQEYFQFDNGPIIFAYHKAIFKNDNHELEDTAQAFYSSEFPSGGLQIYPNLKLRTEELEGERLSQLESDITELSSTFSFLEDKIRNDRSTIPTLVSPDLVNWLAQYFVVTASAKKDQLAIHVADVLNQYLARNQDRMLIWGPHTNTPEVIMDKLPDVDWMRLLQQKPAETIMPLEISSSKLKAISARVHLAMISELNSSNKGDLAISVSSRNLIIAKYVLPGHFLYNFNPSERGPNGIFSVLAQTYNNYVFQHPGRLPWENYRKQQEILNSYTAFQDMLQPPLKGRYSLAVGDQANKLLEGPSQIIPYRRRLQHKELALHMSILEGHVRAANEQKGISSEPNTSESDNFTTNDDRETSAETTAADKGQDQ